MTAMLMMVSLILNGMEALGSLLTNAMSTKHTNFNTFVNKYMPGWNTMISSPHHGSKSLADILWKSYRNGLAHCFAILHAGIEDVPDPDKYHISSGVVQIDAWKLFDDLQVAVSKMFHDVRNDVPTKKQFLRRFDSVYK